MWHTTNRRTDYARKNCVEIVEIAAWSKSLATAAIPFNYNSDNDNIIILLSNNIFFRKHIALLVQMT